MLLFLVGRLKNCGTIYFLDCKQSPLTLVSAIFTSIFLVEMENLGVTKHLPEVEKEGFWRKID